MSNSKIKQEKTNQAIFIHYKLIALRTSLIRVKQD